VEASNNITTSSVTTLPTPDICASACDRAGAVFGLNMQTRAKCNIHVSFLLHNN